MAHPPLSSNLDQLIEAIFKYGYKATDEIEFEDEDGIKIDSDRIRDLIPQCSADELNSLAWDDEDLSPLHLACWLGKPEVVTLILKDPRVDPNILSGYRKTPLVLSIKDGAEDSAALLLADPRVDPNIRNSSGETPLEMAIYSEQVEVIHSLLSNPRTDINMRSGVRTPFHQIICKNYIEAAFLFLNDPKLDLGFKYDNGSGYLDIAKRWNKTEIYNAITAFGKLRITSAITFEEYNTYCRLLRWRPNNTEREDVKEIFRDVAERGEVAYWDYRAEFKWPRAQAAIFFATVVVVSGGHFTTKGTTSNSARFINIASRLPMELQMILCNRVCGVAKDYIEPNNREAAIQRFFRDFRQFSKMDIRFLCH